jgi:hypothetical protein
MRLLLDIGFARMDGHEVRPPNAPNFLGLAENVVLIALTVYGPEAGPGDTAREAGFAHHLVNPRISEEVMMTWRHSQPESNAGRPRTSWSAPEASSPGRRSPGARRRGYSFLHPRWRRHRGPGRRLSVETQSGWDVTRAGSPQTAAGGRISLPPPARQPRLVSASWAANGSAQPPRNARAVAANFRHRAPGPIALRSPCSRTASSKAPAQWRYSAQADFSARRVQGAVPALRRRPDPCSSSASLRTGGPGSRRSVTTEDESCGCATCSTATDFGESMRQVSPTRRPPSISNASPEKRGLVFKLAGGNSRIMRSSGAAGWAPAPGRHPA